MSPCQLTETVVNTSEATCPTTGNRVVTIEVGALAGDDMAQLLIDALTGIVNAHTGE